jgi:hypothetical protein
MEFKLGRQLQWIICLLHGNVLPLRHLIQQLDGGTKGPDASSGDIEKSLRTCEQLPVTNFGTTSLTNCSSLTGADLTTDQKYVYDMCQAISSGHCSVDLAL